MFEYLTIVLAVLLIVAVVGMIVTQSNARKENEKLRKEMEESRALSDFFADMNHEIRTPINTITGFAQMIADTDDKAERTKYASIIADSSNQLQRLVNDVLDISKVDSGKMKFFPERFDLTSALEQEYMVLNRFPHSASVQFLKNFPYRTCMVTTDRTRLLQIVSNFVTNAFKCTVKGSVAVSYEFQDNGIRISVQDTGVGIPADQQQAVFERFKRLDVRNNTGGTGLGLAICKAMAEGQGGKVGVQSEVGVGSTFWVWLPCNPEIDYSASMPSAGAFAQPQPVQQPAQQPQYYQQPVQQQPIPLPVQPQQPISQPQTILQQPSQSLQHGVADPSILQTTAAPAAASSFRPSDSAPRQRLMEDPNRKRKILVAEDDDSNFLLFKVMLRSTYDLHRAMDGIEAVEFAGREKFDAILMDVRMPRLNGIDATAKIRQVDPDVPIIVVTASAFFADRERAYKAGCTDFLTKPVNREELLTMLRKYSA